MLTRKYNKSKGPWRLITWTFSFLVIIPVITIFSSFLYPEKEIWQHLVATVLSELVINTVLLVGGVACFTLLIGVTLGWFTGVCDFYGKRFFSWALALPMALPAYVMAFIFLGVMDFSGPVQGFIRTIPGFESTVFEVRSTPFVIIVIGLTLYPYVYLLSRASFMNQGRGVIEAARTLGISPIKAFFKVALPISRPWIITGLMLVLMETLADFGAVSVFNYDTLTTAIYKSWFGFFSLDAAAQLSSFLVFFAFAFLFIDAIYKSRMRYYDSSKGGKVKTNIKLTGWKSFAVFSFCTVILLIAFVIPVSQLILWNIEVITDGEGVELFDHISKTLLLGGMAAVVICLVSILLAYAQRIDGSKVTKILTKISTIGYALPGTVLAIGIAIPVIWFDKLIQEISLQLFAINTGPIIQGSIAVMLIAYLIRFLAVGFGAVNSAMQNIKPSLDDAASTLGKTRIQILYKIHFPLLQKGILTALILALVDVMKEMPITLMIRPFGWDTLAVKIFELTSEGEWVRAAQPAFYLVLVGIIPVLILIKKMEK